MMFFIALLVALVQVNAQSHTTTTTTHHYTTSSHPAPPQPQPTQQTWSTWSFPSESTYSTWKEPVVQSLTWELPGSNNYLKEIKSKPLENLQGASPEKLMSLVKEMMDKSDALIKAEKEIHGTKTRVEERYGNLNKLSTDISENIRRKAAEATHESQLYPLYAEMQRIQNAWEQADVQTKIDLEQLKSTDLGSILENAGYKSSVDSLIGNIGKFDSNARVAAPQVAYAQQGNSGFVGSWS